MHQSTNGVSSLKYIITPDGRLLNKGTNAAPVWEWNFDLTDHLGNVRVVFRRSSTGSPERLSHTNYLPFGMKMPYPYSSGSVSNYLYNGKELQTAGGLEWYDYGARFYDPSLGRFTTQDRFSEKYYSLSNYQYGGNNPILNIDVNGDSIAIGSLLDRFAGFFGIKTDYVEKVEADINASKNDDPAVKEMIESLEDSPRLHRIEPTDSYDDGNSDRFSEIKGKRGIKQGSIVKYNPDKSTSGKGDKGDRRDPRVGLVHELKHASDADKGTLNYSKTNTGIPMYEVDAVNMENKTRAKTGDTKRKTYGNAIIPSNLLK